MKVPFKAFVLILAAQVVAASSMLHAQLPALSSTQSPAGCHQHGDKTPSPHPQSFVCCLSGHDSAIVQASSMTAPACSDRFHVADFATDTVVVLRADGNARRFISSGDPPAASPLRI